MKLVKQYYWRKDGSKNLNAYVAQIKKELVEKAQLEDCNVKVSVRNKKIVIEKDEG